MEKKKLGALWLKESKTGTKFMSGEIELNEVKTKVVVFKNSYKEEERQPDYIIYLSEERDQKQEIDPEELPF